MKTTTSISKSSHCPEKGFKKGSLYIYEGDNTIILCDEDRATLSGICLHSERYNTRGTKNKEWNSEVFVPFYGDVTIKQTA